MLTQNASGKTTRAGRTELSPGLLVSRDATDPVQPSSSASVGNSEDVSPKIAAVFQEPVVAKSPKLRAGAARQVTRVIRAEAMMLTNDSRSTRPKERETAVATIASAMERRSA
jgi:hypothetical protein